MDISEVSEQLRWPEFMQLFFVFVCAQCVVLESDNQLGSEFKSALSSNNVTVTDADLSSIAIAKVTYQCMIHP